MAKVSSGPGKQRYLECGKCKRTQAIVGRFEPGGVTVPEALGVGWVETLSEWLCPFCMRS